MQFDSFAHKYEEVLDASVAVSGEDSSYFAEYKARYLARVLPRGFAGKVLDFGCGVGLVASFLHVHLPNARIHGFDVSPESISLVSPNLRSQGTFTSAVGELDSDYDLIVVANVMHHVEPPDRQSTVKMLSDRLAVGGRLAIFEHNPANPLTRWVVERCPFDVGVHLLGPDETGSYVRGASLELERRDYIVFTPRLLSWFRPIEPLLARVPIGAQYAILARKPEIP